MNFTRGNITQAFVALFVSMMTVSTGYAQSAPAPDANESETLKIRQVFAEKNRLVAEKQSGNVQAGDEFVATFENQKQCALKVLDVRGKVVTLDTQPCRYSDSLRAGMIIEKSMLESSLASAPVAASAPIAVKASEREPVQSESSPSYFSQRQSRSGLIDLSYMLPATKFQLDAGLTRAVRKEDDSIGGVNLVSIEQKATALGLTGSYGLRDDMTISLTLRQFTNDSSDFSYGNASTRPATKASTQSKGLTDPQIGLVYRAYRGGSDPISAFVGFLFAPSLGDAKAATTTSEGNEYSGGHRYTIAGRITYEKPVVQFALTPSFVFRDTRKIKNDATGVTTEASGGNALELEARVQVKASETLGLFAALTWHSIADAGTTTPGSLMGVVDKYNYNSLELGIQGVVIPDQLLLKLSGEFASGLNSKYTQNLSGYDISGTISVTTLSLSYVF